MAAQLWLLPTSKFLQEQPVNHIGTSTQSSLALEFQKVNICISNFDILIVRAHSKLLQVTRWVLIKIRFLDGRFSYKIINFLSESEPTVIAIIQMLIVRW